MDLEQSPPPLPEKKDNLLLKLVVGGCGCLIVLAIIFIFLFGRIFGFTHGPTRVVETHLKAINSDDYTGAYAQFSRGYRERTSYEDFRTELREFANLLPYKNYSLSRVTVNNDKARVEGTISARDGAIFPVRYDLVREQGKWRISGYQWTAPGERQTVQLALRSSAASHALR